VSFSVFAGGGRKEKMNFFVSLRRCPILRRLDRGHSVDQKSNGARALGRASVLILLEYY
jgi:hypothetical protein